VVGAGVDMYTSVKKRVFSYDMRRAGMVIGIGEVHTPHFLHSAFSTLLIFHTPHAALLVFLLTV